MELISSLNGETTMITKKSIYWNLIKEDRIFAIMAIFFIQACQTAEELTNMQTKYKNLIGWNNHISYNGNTESNFFAVIINQINRRLRNNSKKPLLTASQWSILQGTDKLSKYWEQIDVMVSSEHPFADVVKTAMINHKKENGSKDLPAFYGAKEFKAIKSELKTATL